MRFHSQTFAQRKPSPSRIWLAAALATVISTLAVPGLAQGSGIPAFSQMPPGPLGGPWHFATLPNKNPTAFNVVDQNGGHVLRVSTHDAYGNMVHSLQQAAAPDLQLQLGKLLRRRAAVRHRARGERKRARAEPASWRERAHVPEPRIDADEGERRRRIPAQTLPGRGPRRAWSSARA